MGRFKLEGHRYFAFNLLLPFKEDKTTTTTEIAIPSSKVACLLSKDRFFIQETLIWGFRSPVNEFTLIYNTRLDSLHKSLWRASVEAGNRVLVMVRSFKEGRAWFGIQNRPFALAGIHNGTRFSLLTTEASSEVKRFHSRIPIVVPSSYWRLYTMNKFSLSSIPWNTSDIPLNVVN